MSCACEAYRLKEELDRMRSALENETWLTEKARKERDVAVAAYDEYQKRYEKERQEHTACIAERETFREKIKMLHVQSEDLTKRLTNANEEIVTAHYQSTKAAQKIHEQKDEICKLYDSRVAQQEEMDRLQEKLNAAAPKQESAPTDRRPYFEIRLAPESDSHRWVASKCIPGVNCVTMQSGRALDTPGDALAQLLYSIAIPSGELRAIKLCGKLVGKPISVGLCGLVAGHTGFCKITSYSAQEQTK